MGANVADARGLAFACKPGCGFCCTSSPLVLPSEAPALGARVVRLDDGTLRIPFSGPACGALRADRGCGVYAQRPHVCRVYPYAIHAGRRIQVTVSLACPGVAPADPGATTMDAEAAVIAERALAQPGAAQMAETAKRTYAEFDRRMKEWGIVATPDRLRAALLPHVDTLARPAMLPALFAGIEPGTLTLDGDPARAIGALLEAEVDASVEDVVEEAARDAFAEGILWVEPDLAWASAQARGRAIRLQRTPGSAREIPLAEIPLGIDEDAARVVAGYLTRLLQRDHTEGAAAWIVDASGYQVTLPAAYARVVGEAALHVGLRAGLLAAEEGIDEIRAAHAERGVRAYETAFHSLPTLGAIL